MILGTSQKDQLNANRDHEMEDEHVFRGEPTRSAQAAAAHGGTCPTLDRAPPRTWGEVRDEPSLGNRGRGGEQAGSAEPWFDGPLGGKWSAGRS